MKITRIILHIVNVPERHWWWSDDVYGQPSAPARRARRRRSRDRSGLDRPDASRALYRLGHHASAV